MLENVSSIQSIDNFSLINQTVVKNVKNDNYIIIHNLILKHSDKVQPGYRKKRVLTNYILCQKSQCLPLEF
jgi:glutaminyl-tRNA synthetase